MTTATNVATVQVYRVWIKATPQAIWDAIIKDPELEAEGFTRLTYEIEEADGATRLTVIHDLDGAAKLAPMVSGELSGTGAGGGWAWILSDLKSLLETGAPLAG
jgi:hypothetical protein